jgi:hypothetical protein
MTKKPKFEIDLKRHAGHQKAPRQKFLYTHPVWKCKETRNDFEALKSPGGSKNSHLRG